MIPPVPPFVESGKMHAERTDKDKRISYGAVISLCQRYRYSLWRQWDEGPQGLVLGINPSKADGTEDDHTTRKLIEFGKRWGWGSYMLGNPFGLRATNQCELAAVSDPVGPDNDAHLARMVAQADRIVVAWGAAKNRRVRALLDERLKALAWLFEGRELWCLGTCSDGSPRHPLMLSYDTPLVRWEGYR